MKAKFKLIKKDKSVVIELDITIGVIAKMEAIRELSEGYRDYWNHIDYVIEQIRLNPHPLVLVKNKKAIRCYFNWFTPKNVLFQFINWFLRDRYTFMNLARLEVKNGSWK